MKIPPEFREAVSREVRLAGRRKRTGSSKSACRSLTPTPSASAKTPSAVRCRTTSCTSPIPTTDGVGEVLIKGKGHVRCLLLPVPARAAKCTDDGWFHTGDLGRVDDDGRLYLLGRSKTVIVCAGMKVFPEEVEDVINAVPEVQLSLVTGRRSSAVRAGAGGADRAEAECSNRRTSCSPRFARRCQEQLSSYKVPVEVCAVDDLPKTPSGKLIRVAT